MADAIFNRQAVRAVDHAFVEHLKTRAREAPRKRFRLCLHHGHEDATQEMVICTYGMSYFRPHKHPPGRSESYHLIEGDMNIYFFADDGRCTQVLRLSASEPSLPFMYRLSGPIYHFLLPTSPFLVYHEILTGPWQPDSVVVPAPFAPEEEDAAGIERFLAQLGASTSTCGAHEC